MGVRVLAGNIDGKKDLAAAVLYDSVTMTAFGPIMTLDSVATIGELYELGNDFVDFIDAETGKDPRRVKDNELHALYVAFLKTRIEDTETNVAKPKEGSPA